MSEALVDSGLGYCTAHHGVIECDGGDGPCDYLDGHDPLHRCANCNGSGGAQEPDEAECSACDGQGTTPCTPTPLLYRDPAGDAGASGATSAEAGK